MLPQPSVPGPPHLMCLLYSMVAARAIKGTENVNFKWGMRVNISGQEPFEYLSNDTG